MRPNPEYSEALRLVASDAEREPAWYTYARYCRERERGLRKQSLRHLETFVAEAEQWRFGGLYLPTCREGGVELMARIRTKISVTGFNEADITEGIPYFRQYLRERPWLIEPEAEWNPQGNRLLVTIDTEGDDPKLESEGVLDEVWDCAIAAFRFSSEQVAFDILEAHPVE